MKYWIDTEFIERPYTIDLISIGMVAEDGREFYAESSEVDWSKASDWTLETVRPQLSGETLSRLDISYALRRFTDGDAHPIFWDIFRLMTGWRSPGCSAIWTNCHFTIRNSVST